MGLLDRKLLYFISCLSWVGMHCDIWYIHPFVIVVYRVKVQVFRRLHDTLSIIYDSLYSQARSLLSSNTSKAWVRPGIDRRFTIRFCPRHWERGKAFHLVLEIYTYIPHFATAMLSLNHHHVSRVSDNGSKVKPRPLEISMFPCPRYFLIMFPLDSDGWLNIFIVWNDELIWYEYE